MFSTTFSDKYTLIPQEANEYSEIVVSEEQLSLGPLPSEENAAKTLGALKTDSATGPDLLPARILKRMRQPISYAVSHPGSINPAARNMATNTDGALDRAAIQKMHFVRSRQLPRHPLDTANLQSHGEVSGIHDHKLHVASCKTSA